MPLSFLSPEDRCLSRAAQGDRDALAELYTRTRAAVYGYALSLLKHRQDAEDVMHDAYLQIWRSAGRYRSQGKPMAWMMTIVRNLALDRLRLRDRLQTEDLAAGEALAEEPAAITPEDRLLLQALLETLDQETRQMVVLHDLAGLKHRETAALLGLPLSTVLSRYGRAVKTLNAAWKEMEHHG